MMTLYKRFGDYETMGALFRQVQGDLMPLTLWQRILPVIATVMYKLCRLLGADFEQTMQTIQASGQEADEILTYISIPVPNSKLE